MTRYFQFLLVILLFAASAIFASLNGKPHYFHLISIIFAITCGWYAKKTNFGRL